MDPQSLEKIEYCPGPGYGLWEFSRIPYGLMGVTQACQRGIDNTLWGYKGCFDNYVDNWIVFLMAWPHTFKTSRKSSVNCPLPALLFVVQNAFLGKSSTTHLGIEYSGDGVFASPERQSQPGLCQRPLLFFLDLVNLYSTSTSYPIFWIQLFSKLKSPIKMISFKVKAHTPTCLWHTKMH